MFLVECITGRDGSIVTRQPVGVAETRAAGIARIVEDAQQVAKQQAAELDIGNATVKVSKCRNGLSYMWTIIEVEKIV